MQNAKNVIKAASLVKEFQGDGRKEEEHEDPALKLGRYLARGATAAGAESDNASNVKSPSKADANQNKEIGGSANVNALD